MKASAPTILLTVLLFATCVVAQDAATAAEAPDLVVLEQKWSKEIVLTGRTTNPLAPNEDYIRQTHADKAAIRERDNSLPNQTTERRLPIVGRRAIMPARSPMDTWVYRVKVQNTGAKTIKTIEWEYQFLDPATNQIAGNRRAVSVTKIAPGKTKSLKYRSTRQPTILVNADQLDQKYRDQFKERVVVHRISYTDGSKWQRPQTP